MGKPKAPTPPDPQKTASAQTGTNIGTAIANQTLGNVNQVTPDGALTYSQTGLTKWTDPTSGKIYDLPQYTATQTLSANQQAVKNQTDKAQLNLATLASGQSARLNELLGKPVDLSGAPAAGDPSKIGLPQYSGYDVDIDTTKYENALMERLNPQLTQGRAALETQLANQGLQPGSEAYNRALDTATRQENDARLGVILNAGQEQSRLAGLARDKASFQNSVADQTFNAQQAQMTSQNNARSQYLNELYAQRNQPINEISSLLSGAQVSSPNFVNAQGVQVPTVDYAGLINQDYQNRLGAYQTKQAQSGGLIGGLLGFGGQLASLSDKRAKKDVKKVGELKGHGLYEYSYRGKHDDGKRHIGVMAQDVEKKRPDVVSRRPDGLRQVNYGALFLAGRKNNG